MSARAMSARRYEPSRTARDTESRDAQRRHLRGYADVLRRMPRGIRGAKCRELCIVPDDS